MLKKYLYWFLLSLPYGVMFLPDFQTTYTEDGLLAVSLVYLLLRMANEKRIQFPSGIQPIINAIFASMLYGILWLGLVRGYYEPFGKLLALFPILLILALFLDDSKEENQSDAYSKFCVSLLALNLAIFILLIVWGRIIHRDANPYYQLSKHMLVPAVSVLPVMTLAVLHAKRLPNLNIGKNHLPIVIPILLLSLMVWSGNAYTWSLWYRAGKLEREWTPFQYDKTSQADLYADADRKPYEAAKYYALVKQRLELKGEIPQFWNWDFMMQYRMAYQARRMKDASHCLAWLPPERAKTDGQIKLLQDLWDIEFLQDMRRHTDMFESPKRFWVDVEIGSGSNGVITSPGPINYYMMDIFGRVFEHKDEDLKLKWQPREMITNAVDLEIDFTSLNILTRDGKVILHDPLKRFLMYDEIVDDIHFDVPAGQQMVDMEWMQPFGLVGLTNYGVLLFEGKIPDGLPQEQHFNFGRPVAADLELDPDRKGIYVLDIYGGIHSYHSDGEPSVVHTTPPVDASLLPYWMNQNVAIDLELDSFNRGLYVYNRMGELFTVSTKPFRETYRYTPETPFRGVAIFTANQLFQREIGGEVFALESNGNLFSIP